MSKLTDEQVIDARNNASLASGNTIRAIASELLESRAAIEVLQTQLATVLARETATTARYDARIAKLEADNVRMQEALKPLADQDIRDADQYGTEADDWRLPWSGISVGAVRRARAELGREPT